MTRVFLGSGVLGGCLVWRGVQRRRAAGGSGGCRRFCSGGAVVCGFIRVMACVFLGRAGRAGKDGEVAGVEVCVVGEERLQAGFCGGGVVRE